MSEEDVYRRLLFDILKIISVNKRVLYAVLANVKESIPDDVIKKLLHSPKPAIPRFLLSSILVNKGVSFDAKIEILKKIRHIDLYNASTFFTIYKEKLSLPILRSIYKSRRMNAGWGDKINLMILSHPNVTNEFIVEIINSIPKYVPPSAKEELYRIISFRGHDMSEEIINKLFTINSSLVKEQVMKLCDLSKENIIILSKDPNPFLRKALVHRLFDDSHIKEPYSKKILKELAKDPSGFVREEVARCCSDQGMLEALSKDHIVQVKRAVAQNKEINIVTMENLSKDGDEVILSSLLRHRNFCDSIECIANVVSTKNDSLMNMLYAHKGLRKEQADIIYILTGKKREVVNEYC